jgi:hypothetical protein
MTANISNFTYMKVCLVTVTLYDGGAERCAATLSHFFVNQGFEVHHLVFSGRIEYDYSGEINMFQVLLELLVE